MSQTAAASTESRAPAAERALIVSSDGHATAPMPDYRSYLPESVRAEFDAFCETFAKEGARTTDAASLKVRLDEYLDTGSPMRATVSADLLATIFSPYSPLHDGAVLVRGDEIVGAGCILPLTQNPVSDRSLGTRHRAALGLSEETDALVFVVSEETANVSLASRGTLQRGLTADQVSAVLAGRASLAVAARRG